MSTADAPHGNSPAPRRRLLPLVVTVLTLVAVGVAGLVVWRSPGGRDPWTVPAAGSASPDGAENGGAGAPDHEPSADDTPERDDRPLRGKVVLLDPGHNPRNAAHTAEIARRVDVGNARKECDTTGTATDDGYAEASFTLDLAHRVRALLEERGAKVVFTQDGESSYGPCVDERARKGNAAHADAAVSLHADGSAAGNRGFHVILPARVTAGAADTSAIVRPSKELGKRLADRFGAATGSAPSNYIGGGTGLDVRSDLGGLNLSKVPKVFLECGNMRDPQDAAQLTDPRWRQKAARGISAGITDFLAH